MSLVRAPGPEGRIELIGRCKPRTVFVSIVPRPSAARDSFGHHLHLEYTVAAGTGDWEVRNRALANTQRPDRDEVVVEFDAGSHRLNYGGTLYLTGGQGEYVVSVYEGENRDRRPHWHWLTVVARTTTVELPTHHSVIAAGVPGTVVTLQGGFTATLDHIPIQAIGAASVAIGKSLITGWWG